MYPVFNQVELSNVTEFIEIEKIYWTNAPIQKLYDLFGLFASVNQILWQPTMGAL